MEGSASIAVPCGKFTALLETSTYPRKEEYNRRIEENLETLTNLVLNSVVALKPTSMKLFTEGGIYLPFNAHMAYYRDEQAVLDDLLLIEDAWEHGLPFYHAGRLRTKTRMRCAKYFTNSAPLPT